MHHWPVEETNLETDITVQVLTSQTLLTLEGCWGNVTLHTQFCGYRETSRRRLLSVMQWNIASHSTHTHNSLIPGTANVAQESLGMRLLNSFYTTDKHP